MQLRGKGGNDDRQGRKADGAQPMNRHFGPRAVKRVGQRRAENKCRADQHHLEVFCHLQVMGEGQGNTDVGQEQCGNLTFLQALAQKQHTDQHGHSRVDKQDQPLQRRRDVLQTNKIQNAGAVVTEQPKGYQHAPVFAGQRWCVTAQPQRGPEGDGQGKAHAQGEQGDGIYRRGGVGQLDEDGFEREAKGGKDRQCDTHALS